MNFWKSAESPLPADDAGVGGGGCSCGCCGRAGAAGRAGLLSCAVRMELVAACRAGARSLGFFS
eukprot:2168682-Pyramimonas_sp.AAC.1